MAGYLVLEGGAEFGGAMAAPDRRSLELAGGVDVPVVIIPTAAAPDHNHERAGGNGQRWFQHLGATDVMVAPLIDGASANEPSVIKLLQSAKLIYLLGGFTHYLGQTLAGSAAWIAIKAAYDDGAVIAGSSAGAMVLCDTYFNPNAGEVDSGLGLVFNSCVLPHHNTFGQRWVTQLRELLPQASLIGIDEQTGMINDGVGGQWTVYGSGMVTLYRPGATGKDVVTSFGEEGMFAL